MIIILNFSERICRDNKTEKAQDWPIQLIVLVIITQVLSVINVNNLVFSQIPFLLICRYRFYHRWTKSLETNKWVCNDHRDIPQCFPQDKY